MSEAPELIFQVLFGRWGSLILHTGVELGIFDALAGRAKSARNVARELKLDPENCYRLLRALASLGMLREDSRANFRATAAGKLLHKGHPASLRAVVLLEAGPQHYAIWKHVGDIVRTGSPDGFVREYGKRIFDYAAGAPDYAGIFNDAMSSYSSIHSAMTLDALRRRSFRNIRHLCDVGGGHGHLLSSLLCRHRHLRGTVYDLRHVVADQTKHWARKMGVGDRCAYLAGNMFETAPSADAYIMKFILHDWNDEECVQILSNLHRAAEPKARLFIVEQVVPGPGEPHFAKYFDLHMMVATGGRERTAREYAAIFARAGWKFTKTWFPRDWSIGVLESVRVPRRGR